MAQELRSIFNGSVVEEIGARIAAHVPGFARKRFADAILADFPSLGLLDRAKRIAQELRERLPPDYPDALAILLKSLGKDDGTGGLEGLHGFRFLPFLNFVGVYGLEHPDLSLPAMRKMTKFFTAEGDIRPYLIRYQERVLADLAAWAADPDWRVRRLVSEGMRPRLPWALRLKAFIRDPAPVLALIEPLRSDPVAAVRRSVANNLNDIAKDNPEAVIATARRWLESANPHTRWIVRHGLRTLVKQGHPEAIALLGFQGGDKVRLEAFTLARRTVALGGAVEFSFELASAGRAPARLVIDYRVHHLRANGTLSPKTFKLTTRTLAPGDRLQLQRRHPIVPITTRRYYPGRHRLELLVNGRVVGGADFTLATDRRGQRVRRSR